MKFLKNIISKLFSCFESKTIVEPIAPVSPISQVSQALEKMEKSIKDINSQMVKNEEERLKAIEAAKQASKKKNRELAHAYTVRCSKLKKINERLEQSRSKCTTMQQRLLNARQLSSSQTSRRAA